MTPESGEVRWQGANIRSLAEEYSRSITYIGHRNGVKEELSSLENLRISSGLAGFELPTRSRSKPLARVGLAGRENLPARFLSEGQRRRSALARLITCGTTLWLLDEVLASLDHAAGILIESVIGEHLSKGGMAIVATHQELHISSRFVSAARTCNRGPQRRSVAGVAVVSAPSTLSMFRWIVARDLTLAWRRRADVLSTLFFFVIVVSLFPLGIGPETKLLRSIAPGVVWVAALLASMLSLGRVFANDYQDGTLEQMLLTPQPLYLVVMGKVVGAVAGIGSSAGTDCAADWGAV